MSVKDRLIEPQLMELDACLRFYAYTTQQLPNFSAYFARIVTKLIAFTVEWPRRNRYWRIAGLLLSKMGSSLL